MTGGSRGGGAQAGKPGGSRRLASLSQTARSYLSPPVARALPGCIRVQPPAQGGDAARTLGLDALRGARYFMQCSSVRHSYRGAQATSETEASAPHRPQLL